MKLARVFISEYPGRQVGDIFDIIDSDNHPGSILSGIIAEVEIPEGMDESTMKAVIGEDGAISFEVDTEKVAAKAAAEKAALVTAAYNQMNTDVYAQMASVFGTTKSDSATAFEGTFKLMAQKPELFVNEGLVADKAVGAFLVGDALNTTELVAEYAAARIAEVEAYAVYRMNRIKQFHAERELILNPPPPPAPEEPPVEEPIPEELPVQDPPPVEEPPVEPPPEEPAP